MARLTISGPDGTRDIVLGARLVVGRVEGVDLVLDDKGISRRHCEFEQKGDGWLVRDLGSSNGTLVNGDKVTEKALAAGDRVRLGGITLTFSPNDADFVLRFTSGEHAGRDVPLSGARTTLGRRPDNTVAFADVKVSGVHLEVARDGDGWVLRDLGSTNGTFLDGKKVTTEVALSHGDHVKVGVSDFQFVDLRRAAPATAGAVGGDGAAAGSAAGAGRAAAAARSAPKGSKAAALAGLTGVVLVVGGAAAWYFLQQRAPLPASGHKVAPPPAGSLVAEEWSFESSGDVDALWNSELGDGFAARSGRAASGSYALSASVEGGQTTASKRQRVACAGGRGLHLSGQLAADDGAFGSVALRFLGDEAEGAAPRQFTVVAAQQAGGGSFAAFALDLAAPSWAKGVEVVVVARGEGRVALDDLALVAGAAPEGKGKVGELDLLPGGPCAWYLDHHAPLVELFEPFGSGLVAAAEEGAAPAKVELPAGAFAARARHSSGAIELEPGAAPFTAQGFALLLAPELSAQGVTLLREKSSDRRYGAFTADHVQKLLLGAAAERFEVAFSSPVAVTATPRGDALRLEIATPAATTASLRADFSKEQKEASELYARAQEEWRGGRAGGALLKLRDIRDRLPHDEKTVELARKLEGEIVPKLEEELRLVDAEAAGAEFLGSLDHYRRTLARATTLLKQAEGLDAARDFAPRVERMKATVDAMERERREEEARRLLRLARAYEAQVDPAPKRPATAGELLAELQRSYADTAAAREARGEAAPPPDKPAATDGGNEGGP